MISFTLPHLLLICLSLFYIYLGVSYVTACSMLNGIARFPVETNITDIRAAVNYTETNIEELKTDLAIEGTLDDHDLGSFQHQDIEEIFATEIPNRFCKDQYEGKFSCGAICGMPLSCGYYSCPFICHGV